MQTLREAIRLMVDSTRLSDPKMRVFLDQSKDWSDYDVDNPRLPIVKKVITTEKVQKMLKKESKKRKM